MATLLQTEILLESYVPYECPPQSNTLWTAIPEGLSTFNFSGTLDIKPVNDTALLRFVGLCPPNFGYVMNDLGWNITVDRAGDWNSKGSLKLRTFYRGGVPGLTGFWPIATTTAVKANDVRTLMSSDNTMPWPTTPLVALPPDPGVQWDFETWNSNATAQATGTVNYWISFWKFDLEQIRKFPINSPLPVHAR